MAPMFQPALSRELEATDDWTFNGASTRELTHCYHNYPARMIPQVAAKLLEMFGTKTRLLFDPYAGSGTSLVEALIRGISSAGTDLNPLARLIATAKISTPNLKKLDEQIRIFYRFIAKSPKNISIKVPMEIHGITRLDFWFKPNVINNLALLKIFIKRIEDESIRLFFQVAFSETVRDSSNTRSDEFKLYRYDTKTLEKFNPDVLGIMMQKLKRNRVGLEHFLTLMGKFPQQPTRTVYDFNTVDGIPLYTIEPSSVDIVITSPPYGDSHTTVAYGQYSRLSAAWLDLNEPHKIDNKLMGGKNCKEIPNFQCLKLNIAIDKIRNEDEKRAMEVASFYIDLDKSIKNVSMLVRRGGYACYVVGNRKVKGIILPTDNAVRSFFEQYDFGYVDTFIRSIPNKRMPNKNSPSNIKGILENTMANEYVVVMRRH